jgi:thiol-disulfide isomerase/thioredoxin
MSDPSLIPESSEVDEAPQRRRVWTGPWRSVVLPLVVVAAIVGAIWYIESNGLPFVEGGSSPTGRGDYGPVALPPERNPTDRDPSPEKERAAPDFLLETLDGGTLRLSDLQGKAVLVNFWATWCQPCRSELPHLVAAYNRYRQEGLEIVAVNLQEDEDTIAGFVEEFGMQFPVVIDRSGDVADKFRVIGIPTSFFIDRSGVVRTIYTGPFVGQQSRQGIGESDLAQRIEEILR